MAKIKLTKNELKRQKDALKMYRRYLPTLMLKKQQLQAEIRSVDARRAGLEAERTRLRESFSSWVAVFAEEAAFPPGLVRVKDFRTGRGNIAGVEIPVFLGASLEAAELDLYATPLWVDKAVEKLSRLVSVDLEASILGEQSRLLNEELRTTSQRVNLFEKVKIPEAQQNIKRIRVYLGDQQTAAVVRGKIAKSAMEREGA
jgi:V/A-type H+/Na+-transporting ATPase subunit D